MLKGTTLHLQRRTLEVVMSKHIDPNLRQGPGKPTAKQPQSTPRPMDYKPGQSANQSVHTKLSEAVQPHHQGPGAS
ncbi:hypothetical protein D3C76_1618150 [compost metagenome]